MTPRLDTLRLATVQSRPIYDGLRRFRDPLKARRVNLGGRSGEFFRAPLIMTVERG